MIVVIGMHRAAKCIKTSMRLAFTFVLRAVDKVFLEQRRFWCVNNANLPPPTRLLSFIHSFELLLYFLFPFYLLRSSFAHTPTHLLTFSPRFFCNFPYSSYTIHKHSATMNHKDDWFRLNKELVVDELALIYVCISTFHFIRVPCHDMPCYAVM